MKRIGFIGMGRMGIRMAARLAPLHQVFGTDIDSGLKPEVVRRGITWKKNVKLLADSCDVIFIVVGTEAQTTDVMFGENGILSMERRNLIIIICATLRPVYMQALAERLSKLKGLRLLDCPVARGEQAAVSGDLLLFVGGARDTLDQVKPLLDCLGTDIEYLGPVGAGQVAKMINNYLLWACLTASVEGLDIGEALGIDRERLRVALEKSSGASWAMTTRADDRPALWAEKDMSLLLSEADRLRFPVPIAGQIREAIKRFKIDRHLERSPIDETIVFPDLK